MIRQAEKSATDAPQRRALVAWGLIVLAAVVSIRLPIRTFAELARGAVRNATHDSPRLLELERRIPPPQGQAGGLLHWQGLAQSVLVLLFPCLAAHAVVRAGMPLSPRSPALRGFQSALAVGIGVGLSSCSFFLWLVAFGEITPAFFVVDALFWCSLILGFRIARIVRSRRQSVPGKNDELTRQDPFPPPIVDRTLQKVMRGSFAAVLVIALAGLVGETLAAPDGGWDARAIWNLRARLLVRSGDAWRQAFDSSFDHTDYPLLVPASLARWWTCLGSDPAWPGACLGTLFTLATVAVVVTSLGARRPMSLGLLAGTVLLGTVRFLRCGAAQYADVPLAFFVVATLALLIHHDEKRHGDAGGHPDGPLFLAGLTAALSAWTKNEGLLFLAVTLFARGMFVWRKHGPTQALHECRCLVAGAAPPLVVLIIFKLQVPATNDLIASQGLAATTARLLDLERHWTILGGGLSGLLQVAQVFLVVIPLGFLLLGRSRPCHNAGGGSGSFPAIVIGLMLGGYYAAYLTSPYDLAWHLSTSIDRLLVQIWPAAVLAAFGQLRSPDEASLLPTGWKLAPLRAVEEPHFDSRRQAARASDKLPCR